MSRQFQHVIIGLPLRAGSRWYPGKTARNKDNILIVSIKQWWLSLATSMKRNSSLALVGFYTIRRWLTRWILKLIKLQPDKLKLGESLAEFVCGTVFSFRTFRNIHDFHTWNVSKSCSNVQETTFIAFFLVFLYFHVPFGFNSHLLLGAFHSKITLGNRSRWASLILCFKK